VDNNKENSEFLELAVAYKTVFNGSSAERILEDLDERGGLKLVSNTLDAQRLAYNEGRRSLVLEIKELIGMDLKEYKEAVDQDSLQ
jgi:hypothetical protein